MGGFSSSTQSPQTSGGGKNLSNQLGSAVTKVVQKGDSSYHPQPMGKGGAQTNSATSGQPTIGSPNQYSNTVGQWDNTQIQPVQRQQSSKGKGV